MKKFLTIFMAMVVTMSMSALPLHVKTSKEGPVKHQTESSIKKAEQMEKMKIELPNAEMKRTAATPAKKVAKKAPAASGIKLAPAAKQEVEFTELNYDDFAGGPEFSEDTETWWMGLQTMDKSRPEYGVMIQLDWAAPVDDYTGTFTTEDFTPSYTWALTSYSMGYIQFDSITMTISKEETETLETILVDAQLIGSDGFSDYAFKVHVEKKNYKPTSYVDVPALNATIEETLTGFALAGSNDDLALDLAVESYNGVVGAYTLKDVDLDNTTITYKGTEITPLKLELELDIENLPEVGYAYIGELAVIGSDYVQYTVDLLSPMPAPTDTIDITCVNLTLEWYDQIYFSASNSTYDIYGAWVAEEIVAGVYSGDSVGVQITNSMTFESYSALSTELVVSGSEEDGWAIEGTALCADNNLYKLHLSWYVPEPTDTIVVAFENSAKGRFYPEYGNDLQLFNENDQYYASLNVAEVELGASFTEEELIPMFSGIEEIVDGEYIPVEYALVQNGLLSQVGDTTKMYAEYVTFDGKIYLVSLWHATPEPVETVNVTYEAAEFANNMDFYGTYSLLAYAPDSLTAMVISIYALSEEEIPGTFVNDGKFGMFGEGQYEIDGANTYYGVWNDEYMEYELIYVDKGEVTVVVDEEKNITLTGSLICENAVQYNVTMKSKITKPRLDLDSEDTPVDRVYTSKDSVRYEDFTAEAGPLYFEVSSTEYMDMFNFYLIAETADPDIVLPEGTYEINNTWEYGTVVAGMGIDMWEGTVAPGYYSGITEDGHVTYPFYFLVEGTVEVSKNEAGKLHVEVNAINSYEVPVHLVYDASVTAIENISTEDMIGFKKMMIDGQLVIIRNGKAYNAIGARVK